MDNSKLGFWVGIVILPILLLLISPLWSSYFKGDKSLQYRITSHYQISGDTAEYNDWPDLKVLHIGREVIDANFFSIEITNTGDIPITKDDFHEPITFSFDEKSTVKGFRKIRSTPENLMVKGNPSESSLSISPLLLNPGDSFSIEIFVSGDSVISPPTARITGVSTLTETDESHSTGLLIEKVSSSDRKGATSHRKILRLNEYALFFFSVMYMSSSFLFLFLKRSLFKGVAFKMVSFITYLNYLTGTALSFLFLTCIFGKNNVSNILIPMALLVTVITTSLYLRSLFIKKLLTEDLKN